MLREKVETVLLPLVGLPLWGINRASSMQMFQFGWKHLSTASRGRTRVKGDFGLHIQCAWRIVGPEGIVVGSRDVYYPAGDPSNEPPDFEWDEIGANRRDQKLNALYSGREENTFVVEAVSADDVGGVTFTLNGGYTLELWAHDSLPGEHWRLLQHEEGQKTNHFVMTGEGIEE